MIATAFKNVEEKSTAKNYMLLVFFLWLANSLQSLSVIGLLSLREMWSSYYFQYGFRSSRSTANILTAVCDKITRAFNRYGTVQTVAFDIPKAFDRVCHAFLVHRFKSYGISGQKFGLISFLSNRQL